jgi:hypothetical protein
MATRPVTPECWALPLLEDGWTVDARCLRLDPNDPDILVDAHFERESYCFAVAGTDVVFVDKIKLSPRLDGPTVIQVAEDIFIIPCNPQCAQNPMGEDFAPNQRPPMLILDDVTFPPVTLTPEQGPREFLCAVFVPAQVISTFFDNHLPGPELDLDWFACADMDVLGTFYGQPPIADTSMNGCPDVCIELGVPGNLVPHKGLDEKGAELLDFLLNRGAHGLQKIVVDEPRTRSFFPPTSANNPFFPSCPGLLPGMQEGESHNTRPWCFTMKPVTFDITIDAGQEVPPSGTSGTGTGTFDLVANTLSFNITFMNLSSAEQAAHIHGPAAPGTNAPILFPLPAGNPKIGVWNYPESRERQLTDGLMYVNIHSANFPAGEIRGQIVP